MVTVMCNYIPPENGERARCECGAVMPDVKTSGETWWRVLHMGKGM